MNRISNLILDIGGVVILQPKPDWDAMDRVLNLPIGSVKHIVDDCFKQRMKNQHFDEEQYFKKTHAGIMPWTTYQAVITEYFSKEILNEPVIHWLREKKTSGLATYALTNNTASLTDILHKFDIEDVFERLFNSAEMGIAKPDPRFFKRLLHEIHALPQSCLFVDDNTANIVAAQAMGFITILFTDNNDFFSCVATLGI